MLYKSPIRIKEVHLIKDQWFWISPTNVFIPVSKLNHKDYIMNQYKNTEFSYDYDQVFDKALLDGWVRGIFETKPNYKNELAVNGYSLKRIKGVIKTMLFDSVKYGANNIYIDSIEPKKSFNFYTGDSMKKLDFMRFLGIKAVN